MLIFERLLRVRKIVIFRRPRKFIGSCDFGRKGKICVAINPRRLSPAQVYLHELIHACYNDWSEKKVLAMERHLWKTISLYDKYRLYRKLFNHLYTSKKN